mmetsp:Transcript_18036/g.25423  ORF Transcript_18036/g.25423 Transcript_18036/m.25423 type:complete len:460 (-) Transcript_18036:973-2352(-)
MSSATSAKPSIPKFPRRVDTSAPLTPRGRSRVPSDIDTQTGGSRSSLMRQGSAGRISPSAVCRTRNSSPVIVSQPNETVHHYASGRPLVVIPMPMLDHKVSNSNTAAEVNNNTSDNASIEDIKHQETQSTISYTNSSSTASIGSTLSGEEVSIEQELHQGSSTSDRSINTASSTNSGKPPIAPPSATKKSDTDETKTKKLRKEENTPKLYLSEPPALRDEGWKDADGTAFKVRGAKYLKDKKKQKSQPSTFKLITTDLVQVDKPIFTGLCSHPDERIQKALKREEETGVQELPDFIFAINLVVPGAPRNYHLVMYFGCDDISIIKSTDTPFGRVANKFFFGDSDDFRTSTFKLIPSIVDGNFVVKNAVGSKPAILGKKLKQNYIRTDRFLELICDIGSNPVADSIVKLALGFAKKLAVDMAFVLEGVEEAHLPEQVVGVARIINIDFDKKDGKRLVPQP